MRSKWVPWGGYKWMLGVFSLVMALYIKHPLTFRIRGFETQLQIVFLLLLSSFAVYAWKKGDHNRRKIVELSAFLVLIVMNLFVFFEREVTFYFQKSEVLQAPQSQLHRLGKHFIVGYTDYDAVKQLVQKGAIGGVYITARNLKGKRMAVIQDEIRLLQKIQHQNNLPPLFITSDQEGGITSRLSPPLKRLPPLSVLVDEYTQPAELLKQTGLHAAFQAKDMVHLGINLNLSPVVDLKIKETVNKLDFHTQIYKRAISPDEQIVTQVGLEYCKNLEAFGVIPTLKHFPGLGRIYEDTHLKTGFLNQDLELLQRTDWMPFREISRQTGAFIMLGHVKLSKIDPDSLASFSKKIIQTVIRNDWNHSGVLITDDLNMRPAYRAGIENVAIKALNAGVDLLLISYDGEQYYRAMSAVIQADNNQKLDQEMVGKSRARLSDALEKISIRRLAVSKPGASDAIFL